MRALPFALLVLLVPAAPRAQQAPLTCLPGREGVVQCMDGKLCECRFEQGGSMTGRPDGWRWDCGALRPECHLPPATAPNLYSPMPGVGIEVVPRYDPWRRPEPYPRPDPYRPEPYPRPYR
jgi:hypothetical protein